jgi:uncharacterized protein YcbX
MSDRVGLLISIHRYPVKSMMGEELDSCEITEHGLLGDRAYALVDASDGKVASAKNPKKWPSLFRCRATFLENTRAGTMIPEVKIALPDGAEVRSGQADAASKLSAALGRDVKLNRRERGAEGIVDSKPGSPWQPQLEEYWPEDVPGLAHSGVVTDEKMPEGTFFDLATVHLLTTATLARLQELYPAGRFETQRFRPNLVIQAANGQAGFVETDWIGKSMQIGDEVELQITGPCGRCVMTTLPQGDLAKDPGILRAAVQHNQGHVGVYASVIRGGRVRSGDAAQLQ